MGERIEIRALDGDGRFHAYRAAPASPPRAAIIVVQEIFGVNAGIRAKVDRWADLGYLALAPDMFWRFAPGYDVDPDVPAQMQDAFEVRKGFELDAGIRDVEATIRAARALLPAGGKVGLVGYCLGGRVAYHTATRTDIDASVGYYGAMIDSALGEAHAIARPLLLHFGGADTHITADKVDAVRQGLRDNPRVAIHVYPHAGHGFAATSGARRDEQAARAADARTEAFFADHLR